MVCDVDITLHVGYCVFWLNVSQVVYRGTLVCCKTAIDVWPNDIL